MSISVIQYVVHVMCARVGVLNLYGQHNIVSYILTRFNLIMNLMYKWIYCAPT